MRTPFVVGEFGSPKAGLGAGSKIALCRTKCRKNRFCPIGPDRGHEREYKRTALPNKADVRLAVKTFPVNTTSDQAPRCPSWFKKYPQSSLALTPVQFCFQAVRELFVADAVFGHERPRFGRAMRHAVERVFNRPIAGRGAANLCSSRSVAAPSKRPRQNT